MGIGMMTPATGGQILPVSRGAGLAKSQRLARGPWSALAGFCSVIAAVFPAFAQNGQAGPPPVVPAQSYPIEGPYGPYSDLDPNKTPMSAANTPFAQLPQRSGPLYPSGAPYYGPNPAYQPYPVVPSYQPAYTPPLPVMPPPSPVMAGPAAAAPQMPPAASKPGARQVAAAPEEEGYESKDPLLGIVTQAEIGIAAHDAGVFGRNKEPGADIDMEIRFLPIDWLGFMASPRPHIGFHINTAGATDQVFTGITWEFWFWKDFFIDPSFGLSLNNDSSINTSSQVRKQLGSHILFREAIDLGWEFYGPNSVSILLDHVSHGHILGKENEGMDTLGVRYGYRF
jgi:lipid A 3-O-deacylase